MENPWDNLIEAGFSGWIFYGLDTLGVLQPTMSEH